MEMIYFLDTPKYVGTIPTNTTYNEKTHEQEFSVYLCFDSGVKPSYFHKKISVGN